jgi:RNA-directed DNA polymerase
MHLREVRLPRLPDQLDAQAGTDKWFVATFIADNPVREVNRKLRALTHRRSQVGLGRANQINQLQRG